MLLLILAWIGLFIEIIIVGILSPLIKDDEVTAVCLIAVNMVLVMLSITKYQPFFRVVFCFTYILRLGVMYWDIYARKIFVFPNYNTDAIGYFQAATSVATNLDLLTNDIYGGIYSKLVGIIFYFTGAEELFAQYINVLLGLTTVVIFYKILVLLEINSRKIKFCVALLAFFPNSIIYSTFLIRESVVTMFAILSIYSFVKWHKDESSSNFLQSIIYLFIACSFHAGAIGIFAGYIFMYMFYRHKNNNLEFNRKTIVYFIIFVLISLLVFTKFSEILLTKFSGMNEIDDIYGQANHRKGNAAYLVNMSIDSLETLILYGPIRMFYFLTSPLPMDWRGIGDICAFFMDSLLYLGIIIYSVFNRRYIYKNPICISILIMILSVSFLFGIGVSNSGTAMRHRTKIVSVFIIYYAIISDTKRKFGGGNMSIDKK